MMHARQTQGAIDMLESIVVGMKSEANQGEDQKKQEEKRILPPQMLILRISTMADLHMRRVPPRFVRVDSLPFLVLRKNSPIKIIILYLQNVKELCRGRFSFAVCRQ